MISRAEVLQTWLGTIPYLIEWYARGGFHMGGVFIRAHHIPNEVHDVQGNVQTFGWVRAGLIISPAFLTGAMADSPISFLKMSCTQMAQETAKDAVQIYGGRGKPRSSGRGP